MNLCIGIAYTRTGRYRQALDHLLPMAGSPEAAPYIAQCRAALDKAAADPRP